ncbi:MAG: ATP-binding protein [Thermoguttaceae bacterium]|jgi:PAS domain S-box-containing protein
MSSTTTGDAFGPPGNRRWGTVVRYLSAPAAVAVAVLLKWWLVAAVGPLPTFVIFYPAILLVASFGGGGPGVLATLLSAIVAARWYFPPVGQFSGKAPNEAVAVLIFTVFNVFLCVLAERLRQARWAAAVAAAQQEDLALLDMGNVLFLDAEYRVAHWSQGCRRLYGFEAGEARGRVVHELFHTRFPQPLEAIQRALLGQGHWEGELTRSRKDGAEIVVTVVRALRRDARGRPSAILEISHDVTERTHAEEAMRRVAQFAEQNPNPVLRIAAGGGLLYTNAPGRTWLASMGHAGDQPLPTAVQTLVADAFRQEGPIEVELADQCGRTFWFAAARPPGEQYVNLYGRNVTARKQAEEALRHTAEDLKRSNSDLEQFAYVASHDLQEPLRMVTGFVQLLQRRYAGRLDAEADKYIDFAVDGAKRMQTLINDLLAYSRVGTRGRELSLTDSGAALQQALANLRTSIDEAGAQITNGDLPTVRADEMQLVQLLQNLIGNAIKFRGESPPAIHVDARREEDRWRFAVSDNGIGIGPQFKDRIFLIFQRLHTREHYPGTGIGLAICKKIVDRHGGRIWVESRAGQGATFYFTLPT